MVAIHSGERQGWSVGERLARFDGGEPAVVSYLQQEVRS
jgi:hypothetical protein